MAVRIKRVLGRSDFFRAGDEIVSIGRASVADQLDVLFRSSLTGRQRVTIRRDGRLRSRELSMRAFDAARLVFESMRFMRCRSTCIFCFVDQMPPGLRTSLYEKDDDYRLSFLFGNFITLNDVTERDFRRIIELRLSPIYLSVHAADRRVRERIFGRPMRRDVLADMERLARAGITMHAQIVLIPGVNDGAVLQTTVRRLFELYPSCRSVAVVPVGLTEHRSGLPRIRAVTERDSRRLISWAEKERRRLHRMTGGDRFLHVADECYVRAGRRLPSVEEYDGFPQLANGVGMCRQFLTALEKDAARLRRHGRGKASLTVATGTLGARFFRWYAAPVLNSHLPDLDLRVLAVRNSLFGRSVTVSGLLSGADIARAARRAGVSGCLVIPGNAVNCDGVFLDDLRPGDLASELRVPVLVARSTFLESRIVKRCSEVRAR
jgi:putative radical SAM enzyme (TIGR03279 family)